MDNRIKCIIVDDEPLARKGLIEYVSDMDSFELVGEFDNALKAMDFIGANEVNLIFLDIEMPKLSGLDLLKSATNLPPVILITAFPQYAIDGFELNVLDYLLKPVSFDRFVKAANRVKEYYEIRQKNTLHGNSTNEDYFFIKADNKLVKLSYIDILFAEALQNYVVIHTKERKFITYLTFKSLQEYLPSDKFIRVHKSYIVSASKIDSIDGNDIRIGANQIPISRNLKDEVMDRLLKGKFLKR